MEYFYEISGFRNRLNEVFTLLGNYVI